jgi:hypothetical protein
MTDQKKLLEMSCKEFLMEVIRDSKNLDNKLNFYEKTILYDLVKEMPFSEVVSLLFSEAPSEIETSGTKGAKYAAAGYLGRKVGLRAIGGAPIKLGFKTIVKGAGGKGDVEGLLSRKKGIFGTKGGFTGAAIGVGLLFLYRKLTDPCFRKTIKILNPEKRKLAELNCRIVAIKKVIEKIKGDIQNCNNTKNPESCKNKLTMELNKWRNKYQEHLQKISSLRD